ncbi:hypothetical protein GmHk_02G003496 [Glycine max]|nr:hypothetical protein GmHk_02G003496 [Glycine max]
MARRRHVLMVEAIQAIREMVAVMLQQTNQRNEEVAEFQGLSEFKRNNPSEFVGGYGPEKADLWIQEMEKIFCAMTCTNRQKSENLVGLVKIKEDINDALSVEDAKRDVVDIEESRTKW